MPHWVFYSSKTGKTAKLMRSADLIALQLPLGPDAPVPVLTEPFILVTPSYGDGYGRGHVPRSVIRLLNNPVNRGLLRGVVSTGDRNFHDSFALAGDVVAQKCAVPLLCRIEREGTSRDWARLQELDRLFTLNPFFEKPV